MTNKMANMTQEEKATNSLEKFIYNSYFEYFVLLLVILSVGMLVSEKLFDFSPQTLKILGIIDGIVLVIFAFEFIVKVYFRRFKYFFGDYGWIDLLSILPVFSSAIKSLRGVKLLRGIRAIRALRFLRMLRILRFLKITKQSDSVLKQKVFVPISTASMIIVLIIGYFLVNWQEKVYSGIDEQKFQLAFNDLKTLSPEALLDKYKDIQMIIKDEAILASRINSDEDIKIFDDDKYYIVRGSEVGFSDSLPNYKIVFSIQDTARILNKTELFIILFSVVTIISLIIILNFIVNRIVLNPIARLSDTMDKVVYDVKIPNSNETRREINFNIKVEEHETNDEIAKLAEKYNFLLKTLEEKIIQSKTIFREFVNSMMNLFSEFHNITQGHQIRAAKIAFAIGYKMGLEEDDLKSLFFGMMLHDLGKIGVNKNVLTKTGKFNDEERSEMNRHPEIGFEIAKDFPLISMKELTIIREHHEKFDGTGYPHKISGENLSILSRISVVADIFDALSCPRDYKTAKSVEVVKAIMNDMSGSHIDPSVYKVLVELLNEGVLIVNPTSSVPQEEWITINEDKLGSKINFESE